MSEDPQDSGSKHWGKRSKNTLCAALVVLPNGQRFKCGNYSMRGKTTCWSHDSVRYTPPDG